MAAKAVFECFVLALAGLDPARIVLAAERAGALGIVPVTRAFGLHASLGQVAAIPGLTRFGLSLDSADALTMLAGERPGGLAVVIASPDVITRAAPAAAALRAAGVRLFCEVVGAGARGLPLAPVHRTPASASTLSCSCF